jgi:hypothetical protein
MAFIERFRSWEDDFWRIVESVPGKGIISKFQMSSKLCIHHSDNLAIEFFSWIMQTY